MACWPTRYACLRQRADVLGRTVLEAIRVGGEPVGRIESVFERGLETADHHARSFQERQVDVGIGLRYPELEILVAIEVEIAVEPRQLEELHVLPIDRGHVEIDGDVFGRGTRKWSDTVVNASPRPERERWASPAAT